MVPRLIKHMYALCFSLHCAFEHGKLSKSSTKKRLKENKNFASHIHTTWIEPSHIHTTWVEPFRDSLYDARKNFGFSDPSPTVPLTQPISTIACFQPPPPTSVQTSYVNGPLGQPSWQVGIST